MDLENLRNEIDKIDDTLLELFIKRLYIAEDIAKYKIANSLPVLNTTREREIIGRLCSLASDDKKEYIKKLFTAMFEISRECQKNVFKEQS